MSIFKAAIIDDGAISELFDNSQDLIVDENLEIITENFKDGSCGHASDCISLIKNLTDISDIEWLNISVLDDMTDNGSLDRLIRGLEICESENVKLIHMSIGSVEFADMERIKSVVDRLLENGTVIVAALSNSGRKTYPACIDGVIGVKTCKPSDMKEHIYIEEPFDGINFLVGSEHKIRIFGVDMVTEECNSMAAPVITAKVIDILRKDASLSPEQVYDILKNNATETRADDKKESFKGISEEEIEMPIIGWYMKDKAAALELAEKVGQYFISEGYNAEVCSAGYAGYKSLPDEDIAGYFVAVRNYCMCDILIAVFDDSEMLKKFSSFDIIVTDNNTDKEFYGNEKSEVIDCSGIGSAEIFDEIMRKFE